MTTETEELVRICETLPPAKRTEVADFAHFLVARQDDDRWENLLSCPAARPRLDAFLHESAAEDETLLDGELVDYAATPNAGSPWAEVQARLLQRA
ncbi:MAG: hypothetical protein ACKODH_16205 [Limisphaerales bacterium]